MINWRNPNKELPLDNYYKVDCLVYAKNKLVFDVYNPKTNEWERSNEWDVVAWCYVEELIDAIPREFKK